MISGQIGSIFKQGDYLHAVVCFDLLNELIDKMEDGEIVFADESGGWMIPGDDKQYVTAYLTAPAATTTPESFADSVVPLAQRDSWQNFTGGCMKRPFVWPTTLKKPN